MNRRAFLLALAATAAAPGLALAQQMPSADAIMRRLEAPSGRNVAPRDRVDIREFKRRPDLRRMAPSIDIQSINFAFGSADIPRSEYGKIREIGTALERILSRRRSAVFLIEGHTDAVGSDASNLALSEARAAAMKRVLVRDFRIPPRALDTVGYGERYLLVNTQREEWRNRRVTIRRIDEFVR
ncbi:OmpA family protein [Rhizobiaceae bacterium BDR2-2]|uniref:OmpA family protein n=1 Tax=Ectorhizobium quercum TaxID=2965071 RepID=A0AAE3N0C0_9HYPH|nr:OmpA family protein [Ectorhizobium quercum]MCX8997546.1 OmpA family protein [Ectorhizobium quercum]